MKDLILKHTLKNAIDFGGKANPGAVLGRVLSENPALKKDIAALRKDIEIVIKGISKLTLDEQKEKLKSLDPSLLKVKKKKKKKKSLPELPGAKMGKVVTRIPPEPSKYNHLGHALSFLMNYMYAKKYKGKCVLRFEDTNPDKAEQEYVDAMKEDVLEYLGIKPSETVFVSDDMDKFYSLAEKLIKDKKAYVCFCEREKMQELRHKGSGCDCRGVSAKKNLEEWKKMLVGKFKEGKATLRLKIDMSAKNQVLRDPVIFRIALTPHYRQKKKYKVWPLYDFENAVEDSICGVTHILRSNEFGRMRGELQDYIKEILGFEKQVVVEYGRFNIKGKLTKGREIRELIEKKKVSGWDDPRLITLKALKRRGIVKEAYYELLNEVGITPSETNLDFGVLAAINRRILDPQVNRYFFIQLKKKIKIKGAPKLESKVPLHPDFKKRGFRKFKTGEDFYIAAKDLARLSSGKVHRLMDCVNFEVDKGGFKFHSKDYEEFKKAVNKGIIIHWLPVSEKAVKVEVVMDDYSRLKGIGESGLRNLKVGDVIQFERAFFAKLDKKSKDKFEFWYLHT
ncbi:MAG: glutamate--tRNA ligase [Nanoarchaeota archaeon]|nr:glutamate--tRNA ligase [Nanoarchaeota archaeon]